MERTFTHATLGSTGIEVHRLGLSASYRPSKECIYKALDEGKVRFVLSNPHVHVCLTAPSTMRQFEENIAALKDGPLDEEEMEFIRDFGDRVRRTKTWFM